LKAAVDAGHDCFCLYRHSIPDVLRNCNGIEWIKGDLRSDLKAELKLVDAVIHLAAAGVSPQVATREEYFQVNVTDSLLFIEKAVRCEVSKVIVCGSCFEYGASGEHYDFIPVNAPLEPLNSYGASKASATISLIALAREMKFELKVLRPFHFYGEGQSSENLWPSLKKAALSGNDFDMTLGEQVRDYLSVEEVAFKFVAELSVGNVEMPLIKNVGSGQPVLLATFCQKWWKHWGGKGKLKIGSLPYRKNEVMRFVPKI
jgi:nucleoside-diphosphate-sugar epimerase